MTFLNPLDALIPKIPFSFFADFWVWVTSEARGSVSVGFWWSHQLSSFWRRGGSSQGTLSTLPPSIASPSVAATPISTGTLAEHRRVHGAHRRVRRHVCDPVVAAVGLAASAERGVRVGAGDGRGSPRDAGRAHVDGVRAGRLMARPFCCCCGGGHERDGGGGGGGGCSWTRGARCIGPPDSAAFPPHEPPDKVRPRCAVSACSRGTQWRGLRHKALSKKGGACAGVLFQWAYIAIRLVHCGADVCAASTAMHS